eukprot:4608002-Pleurochrysis_carterae.AAC.1
MVEHGLSVDAASIALRRGKALTVLPPDALPLESKHPCQAPLSSKRALVINDTERRRLCCVDSEQPNLTLATVTYSPKGHRARSPPRQYGHGSGKTGGFSRCFTFGGAGRGI